MKFLLLWSNSGNMHAVVLIIILVTIWKKLLLFSGTVVGIVAKKQCDKAITMKAIN